MKMGAHALRRAELSADEIPSRWHSDSSGFQRILMIAVSSSRRRRGMGRSLYVEVFMPPWDDTPKSLIGTVRVCRENYQRALTVVSGASFPNHNHGAGQHQRCSDHCLKGQGLAQEDG